MYNYSDIRLVHLEITTRCNARCPQCPRNIWGGPVNPHLPLVELSLADCQRLFPPDFVRQLDQLYMCGDYGDPIAAKDTLEVYRYLRACSENIFLKMHTNGGARDARWWTELAQTGCTVVFGIDGLSDTNHLYRRGTQWTTVMTNVEAFIRAGGKAEWAFIVFRHNESQVEAAMQLAKEMGFQKFALKRTKRFLDAAHGTKSVRTPVHNLKGELEYYLESPSNPEYQIALTEPWLQNSPEERAFEEYLAQTEIVCRAVKENMLYVSAEGLALPCCWLGNLYPRNYPHNRPQLWNLIDTLPEGKETLNAVKHGLQQIIEGPFFQQIIPDYWQPSPNFTRRLKICAMTCGECNVHDNQVESRRIKADTIPLRSA